MNQEYTAKWVYPSDKGMCAEFETEKEALAFYEHTQEQGAKARVKGTKVTFQLGKCWRDSDEADPLHS